MTELTERQAEVLDFMCRHLVWNHTHAPVRLIGAAVGLSSTNRVMEHLNALERKGYVERVDADGYTTRRILRWSDGAAFVLRAERPKREPTPPYCESCGDQDDGCEDCNGAA